MLYYINICIRSASARRSPSSPRCRCRSTSRCPASSTTTTTTTITTTTTTTTASSSSTTTTTIYYTNNNHNDNTSNTTTNIITVITIISIIIIIIRCPRTRWSVRPQPQAGHYTTTANDVIMKQRNKSS